MVKTITAVTGGVLLGVALTFAVLRFGPVGDAASSEVDGQRAVASVSARGNAAIPDREQAITVANATKVDVSKTEFVRATALHVRSARADASDIRQMIIEANGIADETERARSLTVLFFRLAEIAPRSALELARNADFALIKALEQTVWRAWARVDFEDALFEAKTQTALRYQNSAAQSLYAAFGYMENEVADRIEDELGISPDRATRGRYLYQLADRSAAEAISFINGLERDRSRREYVAWLAYYVSLRDPNDALRFVELFAERADGEYYSSIIRRGVARENPLATVERLLADGVTDNTGSEFRSALSALAETDLDAAKQYYESARSNEQRRVLGAAIAAEMAKNDPLSALAWARANDKGPFPHLQMAALGIVARSDPQLAIAEALKAPNPQTRSSLVSNVMQRLVQSSPADAVVLLDQIHNDDQKRNASQQLASSWIRKDPDAALDWMLSQDETTAGALIGTTLSRLARRDLDTAIRLLPRIDLEDQMGARQQIALQLASNRSPDEAQRFIQQFEGQPDYEQLQATVVSGVAQSDVMAARQLIDQLPVGDARDRAYVQVISQRAQTDPDEAVRWLRSVDNEALRGAATGQLATMWAASDPVAAQRWVSELPFGSPRDDAIVQMAGRWRQPTDEQTQLIAGIEDRDKRGQAKIRQIFNLLQTDPAAVRRLLKDEDISSQQREQVERMLSQRWRLGY